MSADGVADTEENVPIKKMVIKQKFSALWPNITKKKEPMVESEKYKNIKNKFEKHFSEKPGK